MMPTRLFPLFLFLALAMRFDPSYAQEDSIDYRMPEITISATRTEEPVYELPMAISIVTAGEFTTFRGEGLDEALSFVPGVVVQSRAGGTDVRLSIRGFGARGAGERSNSGTSRGIKVMVDGIPETEPDGRTSFDLIDIGATQKFDVVRSNASALYGSASGGVINLHSDLSFASSFARVSSSLGPFEFGKHSLQAGSVVGESRITTSLSDARSEGWRRHSGSRRSLVNASLFTPLSPKVRFQLRLSGASNRYEIPGPLTYDAMLIDPRQAHPLMSARNERRFNRQGRLGFTIEGDVDDSHSFWGMGFVSPKVLQRSERGTFRDFTRYHIGGSGVYTWRTAWTESLGSQLTMGFDESYQDGAQLFYTLTPSGDRGDTLRQNKREAAENFGLFVQEELKVDSRLSLIAGLRYDSQEYRLEDYLAGGAGAGKIFRSVTPRFALSYQFNPAHSVFANIGGGVETPAFNEVDPPPDSLILAAGGTPGDGFNPLLEPARSLTLEVGTKGISIPDRFIESFSYDLAVYRILISNDIVPWAGGRYYFTAGRSERYGMEVGGTVRSAWNVDLMGSVTVMRSRYLDYVSNLGRFDGNSAAGIPPASINLKIMYDGLPATRFDLSMEHLSPYYADDANLVEVPAYTVFHLSAGTALAYGSTTISLGGGLTNITDELYAESVYINPERFSGGYAAFEPGLPRSLYVTIGLRW